jgi:hypothetical protein
VKRQSILFPTHRPAAFRARTLFSDKARRAGVAQLRRTHRGRYIMFKANVGGLDRILRVIVGLGLIAIVFVGPQTPWGWLGVVPLLTGLFGTCPLYTLLGIRTCRRR